MDGNAKLGSFGAFGSSDDQLDRDFSVSAQRTLAELRRQFPRAFGTVRPLKVGITADLQARTSIGVNAIVEFMRFYCDTPAYLRATARAGAMRYDLDGHRIEPVTFENRTYAVRRLEEHTLARLMRKSFLAFRAALLEPVVIREEDRP